MRCCPAPLASSRPPTSPPYSHPPTALARYAFYNIKRYRGLFNVDTADVLWRLFHAVLLFFKGDFLEFVGGNPDL